MATASLRKITRRFLTKKNNELHHSAHSTYRMKAHIVFAPKFRRKVIHGEIKKDIGEIIRKLCNEKKVVLF